MDYEIKKEIIDLEKIIRDGDLSSFIKDVERLSSYSYLKNLSLSDKEILFKELLMLVQAMREHKSNVDLKLLEAKLFFKQNNFPLAKRVYEEILEEEKDIFEVYFNLSRIYQNEKNYDKAITLLKSASELEPSNFLIYSDLGEIYVKKSNYNLAIKSYKKSIDLNPTFGWTYFELAKVYLKNENYDLASNVLNKLIELKLTDYEFLYQRVNETLNEINKREINNDYNKISLIIERVKELLHTDSYHITHYTSLSTTRALIFNKSKLRISEATFLNDTSEGRTLLNFLDIDKGRITNYSISYEFIKKPYIGSFVNPDLYNDLALWRMYGKENKEEAEGCSLLIDGTKFIEEFRNILNNGGEEWNDELAKEFKFYRVAYLGDNFCKSGNDKSDIELLKKLYELKKICSEMKLTKDILQRISEVAYLFKTKEYQHEFETRLVLSNSFFSEVLDENYTPTKVYVELAPITTSLLKLTIGPKVKLADEWAASFFYSLKKDGLYPKIEISTLPFK